MTSPLICKQSKTTICLHIMIRQQGARMACTSVKQCHYRTKFVLTVSWSSNNQFSNNIHLDADFFWSSLPPIYLAAKPCVNKFRTSNESCQFSEHDKKNTKFDIKLIHVELSYFKNCVFYITNTFQI